MTDHVGGVGHSGNRRSHLEWSSADDFARARLDKANRDSLNASVDRGASGRGGGGGGQCEESRPRSQGILKTRKISCAPLYATHSAGLDVKRDAQNRSQCLRRSQYTYHSTRQVMCENPFDDVGSLLVRNTLADFLASAKPAYTSKLPTTTSVSLVPTEMQQLQHEDEDSRALRQALEQSMAAASRTEQQLALHLSRASALEGELADEREAVEKAQLLLIDKDRELQMADEELVRARHQFIHLHKAGEARAEAAAQRHQDAERQIETLKTQLAALQTRLAIRNSEDRDVMEDKVRQARLNAEAHMKESIAASREQLLSTKKIKALEDQLNSLRIQLEETEDRAAFQRESLLPLLDGEAAASLQLLTSGGAVQALRDREALINKRMDDLTRREKMCQEFEKMLNRQATVVQCTAQDLEVALASAGVNIYASNHIGGDLHMTGGGGPERGGEAERVRERERARERERERERGGGGEREVLLTVEK
jgi:hypothetical protein